MKSKIWIVEDDGDIRQLLLATLKTYGYEAAAFGDGAALMEAFHQDTPQLILLDIQLDGMDGFEICQAIRKFSNIPILFLTCLGDTADIVRGLQLGGDDYVTKPFDMSQLLARVQSCLRRAPFYQREEHVKGMTSAVMPGTITIGAMELDFRLQKLTIYGKPIPLSLKEFQILCALVQHPGRTFSAMELYQMIWGNDDLGETQTLKVHMSNLRKKIDTYAEEIGTICTIRGFGYSFKPCDG